MRLFTRRGLSENQAAGLITVRSHPTEPLFIANYTPKCAYERQWNEVTRICRGLIFDHELRIHARPFPKFFNLGEHEEPVEYDLETHRRVYPESDVHHLLKKGIHGPIEVTEKMDGSLGILYWADNKPCIASRGSFTSEQALVGTQMLQEWYAEQPADERDRYFLRGRTYLFEILYPRNRIVVDYGDKRRLVLLATIDTRSGVELSPPYFYPDRVQQHSFASLANLLAAPERTNAEGYVIRFTDTPAPNLRVKVKHAEYVRLHRILTGINARHIWEYLKDDRDWSEILDGVPEEFKEWVQKTVEGLWDDFVRIAEDCLRDFMDRPKTTDRKTVAEYFVTCKHPSVLFLMLDERDWGVPIWKLIKPAATEPFKNEEV